MKHSSPDELDSNHAMESSADKSLLSESQHESQADLSRLSQASTAGNVMLMMSRYWSSQQQRLEQQKNQSVESYSSDLRNSSYAILQGSRRSSVYHQPQSLPYMSASYLVDKVLDGGNVVKTPRTSELEEYARKYEAKQRLSSRRRITPPAAQQTTSWQKQKRPSLQEYRTPSSLWSSNYSEIDGRESVMTNSSSETVKYQEPVYRNQLAPPVKLNHHQLIYQNLGPVSMGGYHDLPSTSDYTSLPPEPRTSKDLKRFPLQTYNSNFQNNPTSDKKKKNSLRHQMSEKFNSHVEEHDSIQHSKSVPNLLGSNNSLDNVSGNEDNQCDNQECHQSFSYLDPEKKLRVSDNTLKLIQKQALLDYYERQSGSVKRSQVFGKSQSGKTNNSCNGDVLDSGFYSPTECKSDNIAFSVSGNPDHVGQMTNGNQDKEIEHGNAEESDNESRNEHCDKVGQLIQSAEP